MNDAVKKYLKKTASRLQYSRAVNKQLLGELSRNLEDFVADNPDCSYEELCRRFGEPEKAASDLLSRENFEEMLDAIKRKLIRRTVVFTVIGAMLATIIAVFVISFVQYLDSHNGKIVISGTGMETQVYYVKDIEEIEGNE